MANETITFVRGASIGTTIPKFICEDRGISLGVKLIWTVRENGDITIRKR